MNALSAWWEGHAAAIIIYVPPLVAVVMTLVVFPLGIVVIHYPAWLWVIFALVFLFALVLIGSVMYALGQADF